MKKIIQQILLCICTIIIFSNLISTCYAKYVFEYKIEVAEIQNNNV